MSEKLYFLYGSETGNSESIARRLHQEAVHNRGLADAECITLNQAVSSKILDPQTVDGVTTSLCLVVVCSTTGEGEPPENAARFRRTMRNAKYTLHNVRYTVLALGDTNYNNFCAAGKYLDTKLNELGGIRFYQHGEADDGVDLYMIVEPWIASFWDAYAARASITESVSHEPFSELVQQYVDMSVAQEVAIVYANASQVCATFALFLFERIRELGGSAELYPVQYLRASAVRGEPKIVFFIVCTESDAHTLCEACAKRVKRPLPLGLLEELFLHDGKTEPYSKEAQEVKEWLSGANMRAYAPLCVVPTPEKVPLGVELDQKMKAFATACKLEPLNKKFASSENGIRTIANSVEDLQMWAEAALDAIPGVTASEQMIQQSVGWFFESRVASAFREAQLGTTTTTEHLHRHHHHDPNQKTVNRGIRGRENVKDDLVNDYLTPLVFLYSTSPSGRISQIAHDMHTRAGEHHLSSSVSELTNIVRMGFPRRATFVFIVSGEITKAMSKQLRSFRKMYDEGTHFDGVRFAILGICEASRSERFNAYALELEMLLLSLHATKIHCTGLADLDRPAEFLRLVASFEANLWSAIMNPTKSVAYLDAASPNVAIPRSFSSFLAGGGDDSELFSSPVAAPQSDSMFGSPKDLGSSRLLGPAMGTVGSSVSLTDMASDGNLLARVGAVTEVPAFPWEAVPLYSERAPKVPLAFLYSSSGMSRTMANYAAENAKELGFTNVIMTSFSKYQQVDLAAYPNVILFCESSPDGRSNGGGRFKRFLLNASHRPDDLSGVRFSVLGLGPVPPDVLHPAFGWANLLSRLQASRVFPVAIMPSMSQLHSLGLPWCASVFASMTVLPQLPVMAPSTSLAGTEQEPTKDEQVFKLPERRLLVLFGSCTGTCEGLAREIHREALERGFQSRVASLRYFDNMNFFSTETVVVVTATEAENAGGYPDAAKKFARYIHQKEHASTLLEDKRFAVLGLGNKMCYPDTFCKAAVRLDRRLHALGATRVCEVGLVDTSASIVSSIETWQTTFFRQLEEVTSMNGATSADAVRQTVLQRLVPATVAAAASGGAHEAASSTDPLTAHAAGATELAKVPKPTIHIATAYPPSSAVPGIAEHLQKTLKQLQVDADALDVVVSTMNDSVKLIERREPQVFVFVIGCAEDENYPLNGSSFFRLLRQKTHPRDLFAHVQYTVLIVSETNANHFFHGRLIDSRMEELGATRFYARGEAVDSFRLEKTVGRWIEGLVSTLGVFLEHLAEDAQAGGTPHDVVRGGVCADQLEGMSRDDIQTESGILDRYTIHRENSAPSFERADGVVVAWRHMTHAGPPVVQLVLAVPPDTLWNPGQTIGFLPRNNAVQVERLLRHFGECGDAPFHPLSLAGEGASCYPTSPLYDFVDFPVSVGTVLSRYLSLRINKNNGKGLMEVLKKCAKREEDLQTLQEVERALTNQPTEVLDILTAIPSVKPPLRHVMERLEKLQLRDYSICSSREKDKEHVAVSFKLLQSGLCTNWLYEQCTWASHQATSDTQDALKINWDALPSEKRNAGEWQPIKRRCLIPFVIRAATEFRMPRDPLIPLILIGPGTGVNPFIAFLEERESCSAKQNRPEAEVGQDNGELVKGVPECADAGAVALPNGGAADDGSVSSYLAHARGAIHLFFGCRRRYEDFLFKEELSHFERSHVLSSLTVAFSQEANDGAYWYGGCYVQDKMLESGLALCELITQRMAHVFVCGEAEFMAKEVYSTFVELLQQNLGFTGKGASEYMEQMVKSGRYVRDVW